MTKRYTVKNSFRFTTWLDRPHHCDDWVEYFKDKNIPCAVVSKKTGGKQYPTVFAVFRKGKEAILAGTYAETFSDEDELGVMVTFVGFKFAKEYAEG